MTQNEKVLLLKDLCARLPYGVKVKFEYVITSPAKIIGINKFFIECEDVTANIEDVKPYLFPLSSMTEEQKNDCPIGETNLNIIKDNLGCYGIIEIPWRLSFLFIDWCNKNHFDYRGLIPLGLANDATGLNIY